MRIRIGTLLTFILLLAVSVNAQTGGKIEVIESPKVKELVNRHVAFNVEKETINGYRVQIHFGGERKKAEKIRTEFLQHYPEVSAYELYQQPNFKVRVGDFRTRLEAQKILKQLAGEFPSAFIVTDDINLPKLN